MEPVKLDPWSPEARTKETYCPKLGADQWSCTPEECTCHLHPMNLIKTDEPPK